MAKDIAAALGYAKTNDLTRVLDDYMKWAHNLRTFGGDQEMAAINEPGIYAAVMKSRKPEAKAFQKWVCTEVLPSIRKRGSYALPGSTLDITQRLAGETAKLHYMKAAADTMIPPCNPSASPST